MTTGLYLFLNIGTSEMMLILFVALFLFGGKKLPELARGLGRGIREFKDASESIKRDINDQINNFEEEIDEVKSEVKSISEGLELEDNTNSNKPIDDSKTVRTEHQDDISHSDQYYKNYDYDYPDESKTAESTDSAPTDSTPNASASKDSD